MTVFTINFKKCGLVSDGFRAAAGSLLFISSIGRVWPATILISSAIWSVWPPPLPWFVAPRLNVDCEREVTFVQTPTYLSRMLRFCFPICPWSSPPSPRWLCLLRATRLRIRTRAPPCVCPPLSKPMSYAKNPLRNSHRFDFNCWENKISHRIFIFRDVSIRFVSFFFKKIWHHYSMHRQH